MAENIERINSVQYELYSQKFGIQVIQEPKGWNNDTESFERDKNSRGITSKIDIDLEFFGNAADYITNVYNTLGVQEKVILTKYEKNKTSLSEEWTIKYIQELDLGNYKVISRTGNVTVSSREGGLFSDIKNRESDKYDLLNNLSADEVDLGNLKTEKFQPLSKKLFLESLFRDEKTQYTLNSFRSLKTSDVRESRTIPMKTEYLSGRNVQFPFLSGNNSNGVNTSESINIGEVEELGNMFFWRSDIVRELKVKVKLNYSILQNSVFKRVSNTNFKLMFKISQVDEQGVNDIIVDRIIIHEFNPQNNINVEKTVNEEFTIPLEIGQSLSLTFNVFGENNFGTKTSYILMYFNIPESKVTIVDDNIYAPTISRCIKPLVFFDRIVAKITGKTGLVKSSLFEKKEDGSDGEYENIVIDNGLWARGFPDVYPDSSDEEQRIQLTSSFKQAFESFNYLEPLCWYTEIVGSTEYIRIEKATYTQQNFIGIKLGSVDKIEYEGSSVDYFSKVEIGQKNSLEYEGLNGLDETNGKSEFSTFITNNKPSIYAVNSEFRTDATGYELTRRLPYILYAKEDTKRDDHIWMHDAKVLTSGTITHKTWQNRFDTKPIGVYDADTCWNLWLSPMNRLYYGHSYSIQRGLYHYPNKKITFNSSNANQNLVTQDNGRILAESGSLTISSLPTPRVEATKINFTFKMTQTIDNMFKGRTDVNGKDVLNYFGLVEYIEGGIKKYGRLVQLESSEEANITLIKARL